MQEVATIAEPIFGAMAVGEDAQAVDQRGLLARMCSGGSELDEGVVLEHPLHKEVEVALTVHTALDFYMHEQPEVITVQQLDAHELVDKAPALLAQARNGLQFLVEKLNLNTPVYESMQLGCEQRQGGLKVQLQRLFPRTILVIRWSLGPGVRQDTDDHAGVSLSKRHAALSVQPMNLGSLECPDGRNRHDEPAVYMHLRSTLHQPLIARFTAPTPQYPTRGSTTAIRVRARTPPPTRSFP